MKSTCPEDILNTLKEREITHILYNVSEARCVTESYQNFRWLNPKAQENFIDFMEQHVKVLFSKEDVVVGEILYKE